MLKTFSNIQVLKDFTTSRLVLKELLMVYLSKKGNYGKLYFLKGVITGSSILHARLQCDLTTSHIKRWS